MGKDETDVGFGDEAILVEVVAEGVKGSSYISKINFSLMLKSLVYILNMLVANSVMSRYPSLLMSKIAKSRSPMIPGTSVNYRQDKTLDKPRGT